MSKYLLNLGCLLFLLILGFYTNTGVSAGSIKKEIATSITHVIADSNGHVPGELYTSPFDGTNYTLTKAKIVVTGSGAGGMGINICTEEIPGIRIINGNFEYLLGNSSCNLDLWGDNETYEVKIIVDTNDDNTVSIMGNTDYINTVNYTHNLFYNKTETDSIFIKKDTILDTNGVVKTNVLPYVKGQIIGNGTLRANCGSDTTTCDNNYYDISQLNAGTVKKGVVFGWNQVGNLDPSLTNEQYLDLIITGECNNVPGVFCYSADFNGDNLKDLIRLDVSGYNYRIQFYKYDGTINKLVFKSQYQAQNGGYPVGCGSNCDYLATVSMTQADHFAYEAGGFGGTYGGIVVKFTAGTGPYAASRIVFRLVDNNFSISPYRVIEGYTQWDGGNEYIIRSANGKNFIVSKYKQAPAAPSYVGWTECVNYEVGTSIQEECNQVGLSQYNTAQGTYNPRLFTIYSNNNLPPLAENQFLILRTGANEQGMKLITLSKIGTTKQDLFASEIANWATTDGNLRPISCGIIYFYQNTGKASTDFQCKFKGRNMAVCGSNYSCPNYSNPGFYEYRNEPYLSRTIVTDSTTFANKNSEQTSHSMQLFPDTYQTFCSVTYYYSPYCSSSNSPMSYFYNDSTNKYALIGQGDKLYLIDYFNLNNIKKIYVGFINSAAVTSIDKKVVNNKLYVYSLPIFYERDCGSYVGNCADVGNNNTYWYHYNNQSMQAYGDNNNFNLISYDLVNRMVLNTRKLPNPIVAGGRAYFNGLFYNYVNNYVQFVNNTVFVGFTRPRGWEGWGYNGSCYQHSTSPEPSYAVPNLKIINTFTDTYLLDYYQNNTRNDLLSVTFTSGVNYNVKYISKSSSYYNVGEQWGGYCPAKRADTTISSQTLDTNVPNIY